MVRKKRNECMRQRLTALITQVDVIADICMVLARYALYGVSVKIIVQKYNLCSFITVNFPGTPFVGH